VNDTPRRWTPVTTGMVRRMRELCAAGQFQKAIAHEIGVHESTVRHYVKGVVNERRNEENAALAEMWRQGVSTREIGFRLGVTGAAISIRAKNLGLPTRKPTKRIWENMTE
jgi:predicted transcriptional regulator